MEQINLFKDYLLFWTILTSALVWGLIEARQQCFLMGETWSATGHLQPRMVWHKDLSPFDT